METIQEMRAFLKEKHGYCAKWLYYAKDEHVREEYVHRIMEKSLRGSFPPLMIHIGHGTFVCPDGKEIVNLEYYLLEAGFTAKHIKGMTEEEMSWHHSEIEIERKKSGEA